MILTRKQATQLKDGTNILLQSKRALLERCRRCNSKQAAIGGDQDRGFEQSFASLAYAYIQDKAPALLDYLIGFQLVDRNDDNTKAVGVFGFKIGPQWVYAPVFFMQGDLKGHELLYLKQQDVFVPMKENWVNYVVNKRPHVLGEPVGNTPEQMGVLQPDLQSLSQAPNSVKFSSWKPWAKQSGLVSAVGRWATQDPASRYPGLDERLNLASFLASDVGAVKLAYDLGEAVPDIKAGLRHFYGPQVLKQALLELQSGLSRQATVLGKPAVKLAAATKPPAVEVITEQTITVNKPQLDESEARKLLQQGYLIRDHRNGEEVSVVYNTQIEMALVSPDQTGVYDVLLRPHEFRRCLVVKNPHSGDGRRSFAVLVALGDGNKQHDNVHPTRLFIRQESATQSISDNEYDNWYKQLSGDKSLRDGGKYLVVAPNGTGTVAFRVSRQLDDNVYEVSWEDYAGQLGRPEYGDESPRYLGKPYVPGEDILVFNSREGTSFRSSNGRLYVPSECKVLQLAAPAKCRKCDKPEGDCVCDYFRSSPTDYNCAKLIPGGLADMQLDLLGKQAEALLEPVELSPQSDASVLLKRSQELPAARMGELKIWSDHNELVINRQRMSKLAGLIHLVRDHGLREKVARKLITDAEKSGGSKRYYVKYAMPGMLGPYAAGEGMGGPAIMDPSIGASDTYGGIPAQYDDGGQYLPVPEMSAANTDPSIYDPMQNIDPGAQQVAQQAYQNNQREVFDTAMLGSMLKAMRNDSQVTRYLGDLAKALDRLGRILFMFYWHNEEFMEQYGKQDLPELEDTLRNAFEVLGDLVLFLKQKTVSPQEFGSTDLSQAAYN